MERYENKISQLKSEADRKQEQIFKIEDQIDKLREDITHYEGLQARLPERHHFTWEREERKNLLNELKDFIDARAKIHKRTPVAIAAQIHHQKWLMMSENFISEEDK